MMPVSQSLELHWRLEPIANALRDDVGIKLSLRRICSEFMVKNFGHDKEHRRVYDFSELGNSGQDYTWQHYFITNCRNEPTFVIPYRLNSFLLPSRYMTIVDTVSKDTSCRMGPSHA